MSLVVDPSGQVPHVIFWSTMNIFASCSQVFLLGISTLVPRLRRNHLLLNLEFIFLYTCGTQSILVWTSHALDKAPPFKLCLFNASAVLANTPLQAGAALALVTKIWASALLIHRPTSPFLHWISDTYLLFLLPYILGLPVFITALVIGSEHPETVSRGSPFYCTIDNDPVSFLTVALGVASVFFTLVFAGWTATMVVRSSWRVRFERSSRRNSLPLVLRTLIYSLSAAVALGCGIASALTSFSEAVPDMVLSITGPAVFFIFASDKDLLYLVFHCVKPDSTRGTSGPLASGRSISGVVVTKRSHVVTEPGLAAHELVTFPGQSDVELVRKPLPILPRRHADHDIEGQDVNADIWSSSHPKGAIDS